MLFLRLRSDIAFDWIWPEKSFYSQAKATALYQQLLLLSLFNIVDGPGYSTMFFPFFIRTHSNCCHCLAAAAALWCCQKFWNTIHVSRMSPISVFFFLFACIRCDSFVGKRPSIRKNCVKMAKIQINFFCNKTIALFLSHFPITNDFFLPFSALFLLFRCLSPGLSGHAVPHVHCTMYIQ